MSARRCTLWFAIAVASVAWNLSAIVHDADASHNPAVFRCSMTLVHAGLAFFWWGEIGEADR